MRLSCVQPLVLCRKAATANWEKATAVGEGDEYRTEIDDDHGSALTFDDHIVHGSVLASP
jgi:hypothetical protein